MGTSGQMSGDVEFAHCKCLQVYTDRTPIFFVVDSMNQNTSPVGLVGHLETHIRDFYSVLLVVQALSLYQYIVGSVMIK